MMNSLFVLACSGVDGRLQVQTKDNCMQNDWSDPWFPLMRPDEKLMLDYLNRPKNAVRVLAQSIRDLIQKHVDACFARIPPEYIEEIQNDLDMVLNQKPGNFHWLNGGRFAQEDDPTREFHAEPDEEKLEFQRPPGVSNHPLRPGFIPTQPGFLLVGNYVAVAKNDEYKQASGDSANLNFFIGRIVEVHPRDGTIRVSWFKHTGTDFTKAKWRVSTLSSDSVIPTKHLV